MVCRFSFGLFVARPQILNCLKGNRTRLDPESGWGDQGKAQFGKTGKLRSD